MMENKKENLLPYISVIVPAKNEAKYIGKCIESLQNQSYPKERIEVIVVDNKSTDETALIAKNMGVRVLQTGAERIGQVRNFGVQESKGEYLFFIDADCLAKPLWIARCQALLSGSEGVGAVGGEALVRNGANNIEKFWLVRDPPENNTMKYLNGSSMAFSRKVFFDVGGFKEDINAGEDSFFANSLRLKGLKLLHDSNADVIHLGYPRTLLSFFKTQFWHSSSYLKSNLGLREYMFWFTLLSLSSLGAMIYSVFLTSMLMLAMSVIVFSIGPVLFLCKKLKKTKIKPISSEGLVLLLLCFTYFIARALGLLYSISGSSFYRKKRT